MRVVSNRSAVKWAAIVAIAAAGVAAARSDAADPATRPAGGASDEQASVNQAVKPKSGRRGPVGINSDRFIRFTQPGDPDKAPYLGVLTSPAQPALQKQLRLKPGVGLVVDGVEPGSPAAEAGVREFDVLHKFDDQLLINAEQFDVLVRASVPGREVALTVIREGKPQEVKATLTEREVMALRFSVEGMPREYDPAGLAPVPGAANPFIAYFDAPVATNTRRGTVNLRSPDGNDVVRAAKITIESDGHKLTVTNPDGRRRLKIEDKAGETLFEGPIETKEELEKVPPELRQTYEDLLVEPLPSPPTPATTKARTNWE